MLTKNRRVKVYCVLACLMERADMKTGEQITVEAHFSSKNAINLDSTDVIVLYSNSVEKMMESKANYQSRGSNWRFKSVVKMDLNTISYKPLKGKSSIPLPSFLANKKAIINTKNKDNQCFKWCITRALYSVEEHSERITDKLRQQANKLDWTNIDFPVAADANVIRKFEKNNNINVNIFGYEEDVGVYPLYISAQFETVDQLLFSNGDIKHYCLIKNFHRLMTVRTEKSHHSMHYCKRCLTGYRKIEKFNEHTEYCAQHDAKKIEVPKAGTKRYFKHYFKSMRVPFVVYADFESFIKSIDTCQPNPEKSYTNKYQKHTPSSFCYRIKCFDDSLYKQEPVTFTARSEDDDVAQIFVNDLEQNIKDIYQRFKIPEKMIFTESDKELYNSATLCHICEDKFKKDVNMLKVRDHCHLTGKFRGAAHKLCNLRHRVPKFFPVVIHNLSGYDSHLFIKKLQSAGDNGEKIKCIPTNEEKYISFSKEVIVD